MPENVRSKTRLFADDTIVFLTITSDIDATHLQEDLDQLALWEENWKMKFHPEKWNVPTISKEKATNDKEIHSSRPPTRTGNNSKMSRCFNNIRY